jgi:tetratricopeptide (TPR) repeat protein
MSEAGQAEHAFHTAVMLMRAGRREEASQICWEVVRRNPRHADAWAMRARIESEAGRQPNAMLHHGFALQAEPDRHDLWCNRGIDAMGARMYKESEESFQRSLAIQDSYEGHYNYGNLLSALMRVDEAVEQFKLALAIDSKTNPQIHANLGVAMIGQDKWHEGFNAYRHRFNAPGFPPRPRFDYPLWRGEPIEGKTIMLYVEQGFGDEIMSLRFAKTLRDMGAYVILAVRPPMYRLARNFVHAQAVILMYDPPPHKPDFMCALLDVPAFADINPDNLPLKSRYLFAEDRSYRLDFSAGLNVGVCWASGKRSVQPSVAETARQKSLSFEQLVAPLAQPGVNLISLQQQHDDSHAMRDLDVKDPMAGVTDFADTAWIIDQLDLVITVDTSVAHLAGALGKPVWNMVRFDALWPWRQETDKTCWYDSMRLYRQTAPYDWREPLARVKADLTALLADRPRQKVA